MNGNAMVGIGLLSKRMRKQAREKNRYKNMYFKWRYSPDGNGNVVMPFDMYWFDRSIMNRRGAYNGMRGKA